MRFLHGPSLLFHFCFFHSTVFARICPVLTTFVLIPRAKLANTQLGKVELSPEGEGGEETWQTELVPLKAGKNKREVKNTHVLKCFNPPHKCVCIRVGEERVENP